jgi:hypothetical protein
VSGELLVDPATPADEPEVDEVHEPPMQRAGNEMPHYPADWIAAHLPAQSVSVRIVVDREGKVARVEPIAPLLVGAHADAFQAATTSAVQAWSFEPFRVIHWVDGPDKNGDGIADSQEVGSMEARPFRFDMRFHFELVDGVPRVH